MEHYPTTEEHSFFSRSYRTYGTYDAHIQYFGQNNPINLKGFK